VNITEVRSMQILDRTYGGRWQLFTGSSFKPYMARTVCTVTHTGRVRNLLSL